MSYPYGENFFKGSIASFVSFPPPVSRGLTMHQPLILLAASHNIRDSSISLVILAERILMTLKIRLTSRTYVKWIILAVAILSHSSYRNCAPSTSAQALFLSSALSAMSLTTKKRFVMKQAKSELFLPKENEIIARVLRSPGRNLHEVDDEKGEKYLVSMPRKFRETIYIKRGSFVFVVPIKEGVKVKAEITQILDDENVLYIREQKVWPKRFKIYAESITREAKRGIVANGTRKHDVIDEDMLPPSDTNDDDEYDENDEDDKKNGSSSTSDLSESEELREDDEIEDSDGKESNSDDLAFKIYNPNRLKRL